MSKHTRKVALNKAKKASGYRNYKTTNLVTKGQINTYQVNQFLKQFNWDPGTQDDIRDRISNAIKKKKTLTKESLASAIIIDRTEKMFANAGFSLQEISQQIGVPEAELLNDANWSDGHTKFHYFGKTWVFIFNYTGEVLIETR